MASVTQGLLRSNFLRIWVFLELGTLSYLFYLFSDRENFIFKEGIKLFLIQALRGLQILISLLQLVLLQSELLTFFTVQIIMFKIGAAPFYGWLLNFNFLGVFRVLRFIDASLSKVLLQKSKVVSLSLLFMLLNLQERALSVLSVKSIIIPSRNKITISIYEK